MQCTWFCLTVRLAFLLSWPRSPFQLLHQSKLGPWALLHIHLTWISWESNQKHPKTVDTLENLWHTFQVTEGNLLAFGLRCIFCQVDACSAMMSHLQTTNVANALISYHNLSRCTQGSCVGFGVRQMQCSNMFKDPCAFPVQCTSIGAGHVQASFSEKKRHQQLWLDVYRTSSWTTETTTCCLDF